jgi:hypothetical protein
VSCSQRMTRCTRASSATADQQPRHRPPSRHRSIAYVTLGRVRTSMYNFIDLLWRRQDVLYWIFFHLNIKTHKIFTWSRKKYMIWQTQSLSSPVRKLLSYQS